MKRRDFVRLGVGAGVAAGAAGAAQVAGAVNAHGMAAGASILDAGVQEQQAPAPSAAPRSLL